jgi:hypothetical protein
VIPLLRAVLFLEFGVMLIVLPWSMYWDRNYFADFIPQLHDFIINNFVRGAVSGLGVINLVAGISEFLALHASRDPAPRISIESSHPAEE